MPSGSGPHPQEPGQPLPRGLGPRYPAVRSGSPVALLPIVTTVGANAITATSVTLIGSVNPQGLATNWWFTYGTTQQVGTTTTVVAAGSGTVPVTVTVSLSGLTTGTTYYYAAVGQSSAGTVYGAVLSFVPLAPQQPATPPILPLGTPSFNIPHFNMPFTMAMKNNVAQGIEVVEQDSFEEVLANVNVIADCGIGACQLLPDFGIPDYLFSQMPANTQVMVEAIQFWEPRANASVITQLLADGQSWGLTLTTSPAADSLT